MTIASADPRVLLKIDTQGYDLRVLEGAAGALDYRPAAATGGRSQSGTLG
jgi:hypothetical protein